MAAKWTEFHRSTRVDDGENDVRKNVIEVILGSDWSEKVESELEKLNFPLNDYFLFEVIWKLRGEPLRALKFFKWVASSQKYEHNSLTYGGLARVLARGGLFDEFWDLVIRMRSEGIEIDHDSYLKITRCIGIREAVKLFEFMMDSPYMLSDQECVWLLMNISRDIDPDIDLVNRVVNKYSEAGNAHTKAIYHVIHRSLCKAGKFDEANKIVEDMRSAGYKPDNITYSQEVYGLCKHRRFEDASLVLNRMEPEGYVPDLKTWTILIQRYLRAGQVDQALSCFAQMLEKKLEPDAEMLEVLVKGFLSENNLLGAYKFLVEMVNKANLKPWHVTYKLMIDRLLQGGELEEAFDILSMMKQQSYPPYAEPFFVYISKFGTVEEAKKLLRALPKKGSPSNEAYVKVISSFFGQGRHSEAKDLLDSSPHRVHNQKTIQKMFGLAQSSSPV